VTAASGPEAPADPGTGEQGATVGGSPAAAEAPAPLPLAGFTIAITNNRRSEELTASFTRRGARVLQAPTLQIVPLAEDTELLAAIRDVIARPPDDVVVTTAIGFRGWVEAADAIGLAGPLLEVLGRAQILARGPKSKGAIRAAGLVETWSAESETAAEVVEHLLERGVAGRTVAVQMHGEPDEAITSPLESAGAYVHAVPVYRWAPSPDPASVVRAVEAACARTVDAVVFTSAPGARALLRAAEEVGRSADLLDALRSDVVAAAVGPVTAGPLVEAGLQPLVPDRSRLGALVRAVSVVLEQRAGRTVQTVKGPLQLRGQAAVLDGRLVPLPPGPITVLRTLMEAQGQVVLRSDLLAALPSASDEHAVEAVVGRLRSALGEPGLVATVVKRGYRLAT
jgi:uroporphyrinogen-III synthase